MKDITNPTKATIEDKLNKLVQGYTEWLPKGLGLVLKADIQAIITTETTEARQEAWDDCALHIAMQHYMLSAKDFKEIMLKTRAELGIRKADDELTDMVATDLNQAEATKSRPGAALQKEQKGG